MRDLDAHSWVEVWFPDYGWVTRDPTPAAAPPRAQPGDGDSARPNGRAPDARRTSAASASATSRATARWRRRSGTGTVMWIALGVLAALCWAAARCSSGAAAGACRRPRCARWRSSSARCAARATSAAPGMTLSGFERAVLGLARRGGLRTRAARAALLGPRRARRRPSSGAGCARRSPATRACSARGGRCRRGSGAERAGDRGWGQTGGGGSTSAPRRSAPPDVCARAPTSDAPCAGSTLRRRSTRSPTPQLTFAGCHAA